MAKLLLALAVAWFGWWLWQGPKKVWTDGRRKPQRSEDEISALAVLGLDPGASPDEIRVAHRRLLRNVHPDHVGEAANTVRTEIFSCHSARFRPLSRAKAAS